MSLKDELSGLPYLQKAIEVEKGRLQSLRDAAGIRSPSLSGMPTSGGPRDKLGEIVPQLVDGEAELLESIRQYSEQRERLLRFINGTKDAKMRMILILRFIDQKSWQEVADYIDNGEGKDTDYNVRQACYRFLDAEEKRQRSKAAPGLKGV